MEHENDWKKEKTVRVLYMQLLVLFLMLAVACVIVECEILHFYCNTIS